MLITFGKKYFGHTVQECPSSFLLWILESYAGCDSSLRNACQAELAHRLSLNFDDDSTSETELRYHLMDVYKKTSELESRINHLEALLAMSTCLGANPFILEGYDRNPPLLSQDLKLFSEILNDPEINDNLKP